jgi:RNase H-like domain found in reverse transcriptase
MWYTTYQRELLEMVRALKHWKPMLKGYYYLVEIQTYNKNLLKIKDIRIKKDRHWKLNPFLARFPSKIS